MKDQTSLAGSGRNVVLEIVAKNADTAIWEQLHTLARTTVSSLEKREYYNLLGTAFDPGLARRALELALTEEAVPTLRPALVANVASEHPEMAFDFMVAHWDVFSRLVEPASQYRYVPRLLSNASDPAVLEKLSAFAAAHIPASADQDTRKTASQVRYLASIRKDRLPEVDRWLSAQAGVSVK